MGWGALATRPWTRAPLLLRRQPAVLLGVAGAAAVLAAAASAPPLFSSTVGTAALQRQVAERCDATTAPYVQDAGPFVAGDSDPADPGDTAAALRARAPKVDALLATIPGAVGPVQHLLVAGRGSRVLSAGGTAAEAQADLGEASLVVAPGALAALPVVADAGGQGVAVTDTLASQAKLGVGGPLHLLTTDGSAVVRVREIYRDPTPDTYAMLGSPLCQLRGVLGYFVATQESFQPPQVILTDTATLTTLDASLHFGAVTTFADQPVALHGLDLAQATRSAAALPALDAQLQAVPVGLDAPRLRLDGQLADVTALASAVRVSVAGATGPVSVAGALVALLLVAGAGAFWLERRRQEVRLLASRGVGPVPLGLKAALEMLPAAAAGTVAGWALAVVVVRGVGPSDRLEAGVPLTAGLRALALAAVGLLLLAIVGGVGGRATTERSVGASTSRWRYVPVELVLVAAAVVTAVRLRPAGSVVAAGLKVASIDEGLLAFPLLLLAGSVAVALRLLLLGLSAAAARDERTGSLRRERRRRPARAGRPAGWLATRRVLASPAIAVALCAAAALPVGVLVYSTGLTAGSRATLAAKTSLFVGSGGEVSIINTGTPGTPTALPAGFRPRATIVRQLSRVTVNGLAVDVHAVDPAGFTAVAAWDPSYAGVSLATLMRRITVGHPLAPGQALPVIEVGVARTLGAAPTLQASVDADTSAVPTTVVGTASVAPGQRANPLFLADAAALAGIGQTDDLAVLSRTDAPALRRALNAAGLLTSFSVDGTRVVDAASFLPITWTFGYLQALAALTGLLTVGAVLLHLEVRQRSRAVAYAMSRRMGLSRAAHLRSLLVELAAVLVPGALIGGIVGWIAVVVAHGHLDPTPDIPPGPLLRAPLPAVAAVAAGLVVVVACGAAFAQRRADTTDVAAALRA